MRKLSKEILPTFALWTLAVLLLTAFQVFAQAAAPVAAPTFLDGILKWIGENSGSTITTVVLVLEFLLRLLPTAKVMSFLVPLRYGIVGVAAILTWLASVLDKLSVVGNNVKP